MNKPDDVSAEAWEVVAEHHGWLMECWPSTAMKLPSVTFDQLARSLDAAIQSAVEAERSRCASYHEQQVRRHENSKLAISERAQEWGVQAMDRQASLIADVSIEIHRDAISAIRKGA